MIFQKLDWSHPKCFSFVAAETRLPTKNDGEDDASSDGPDAAAASKYWSDKKWRLGDTVTVPTCWHLFSLGPSSTYAAQLMQ